MYPTEDRFKESKFFMSDDAQEAIQEAIQQDEVLVISNELKLVQVDGAKLILFEIKDYKALKESLSDKNTAESCLKLILAFDSTDEGQELKNALKGDLKGFKYDFITVDWEDIERSGNISQAIAKAKERVNNIRSIEKEIKKMNVASNFMEYLKHIESLADLPAIKTGFSKFDEALGGGLYGGRLYAIGAISSLGKTSFALNIADNVACAGRDVLIFSLEMGKYELMTKSISRETFKLCLGKGMNINNHQAFSALEISDKASFEKYSKDKREILQAAIDNYINSSSTEHLYISEGIGDIGVKHIREAIDNFKQLARLAPVVIVDYMQILSPYNERLNDKQNIDKNITELKRISRDYNIPVIVISSFNRTNYLNEVSFESFKESGSIEYSADVLIGLQLKIDRQNWTDSKPTLNEKREIVNEAKIKLPREIELIILKNRMHKAWEKIDFNYYPQFDYFEETQ